MALTTRLSKRLGRIFLGDGFFTNAAKFLAAWISILLVMNLVWLSSAPRKMPGKVRTLFIWFGKSERPVETMNAPALIASAGIISGVGLANAKIIGLRFID